MSDSFEFEAQEEKVQVEAPTPKPAAKPAKVEAVKEEAKTPASESAISARAAAVVRNLGTNAGQMKTKALPDPFAESRGRTIADKFLARATNRNN